MDVEFHYHITHVLARKGGFSADDASVIAYACQYTDDNNDKYQVAYGKAFEIIRMTAPPEGIFEATS